MEKIRLQNILPHVFRDKADLSSEVWLQTLELSKGQTCLVEAASGKGKSTFCSYLIGYRNDFEGQLLFDQRDTSSFKAKDWVQVRKQEISYLFQELRLFPELTAYENVAVKNRLTGFKTDAQIRAWFEELQIDDKLSTPIGQMSYGQQQRVALIRALVQPFDFILLDEPISHLDEANAAIMGRLLMQEAREQGAGVIMTSIGKHIALNYDKTYKL